MTPSVDLSQKQECISERETDKRTRLGRVIGVVSHGRREFCFNSEAGLVQSHKSREIAQNLYQKGRASAGRGGQRIEAVRFLAGVGRGNDLRIDHQRTQEAVRQFDICVLCNLPAQGGASLP